MSAHLGNSQPTPSHARREAGARFGAALLSLGIFAVLAGGLFLLPFVVTSYAIQNDVYMTNLFLSPVFVAVGVVCALIGMVVMRVSSRAGSLPRLALRPLALAVVGLGVVAVASALFGGRYESFPAGSVYWPPYLNAPLLVVALIVGMGALIAGWLVGWSPTGDQAGSQGSDQASDDMGDDVGDDVGDDASSQEGDQLSSQADEQVGDA
ncbi:MAG TPA: hypothetical protein VF812_17470 [Ktedonobacterales bacterium]